MSKKYETKKTSARDSFKKNEKSPRVTESLDFEKRIERSVFREP